MRLDDLEGKVIAERFQLKSMIGKGGYGAVFEAIQLSVKRRCAVKILLPGRSDKDAVESRFHSEARTTSRLTHPNSLVLYDFGVDEKTGFLFLATEFIDGKTLHQVLETRGTLSVSRTLTILEQVAASLADAHSHGLVHRDIKPKNIMIVERAGQKDFVKVIDFGIAKVLGARGGTYQDLTQTGMLVGTTQYMAPEQLLGGDLDGRVDQYTMAVVGYKMLTGRNPFRGATTMKTAMRHVNEEPLPLRTYRPELKVSAEFEDVFLRALEKTPEHRYPDTMSFVEALRGAVDETSLRSEREGSLFGDIPPEVLQKKTMIIGGVIEKPIEKPDEDHRDEIALPLVDDPLEQDDDNTSDSVAVPRIDDPLGRPEDNFRERPANPQETSEKTLGLRPSRKKLWVGGLVGVALGFLGFVGIVTLGGSGQEISAEETLAPVEIVEKPASDEPKAKVEPVEITAEEQPPELVEPVELHAEQEEALETDADAVEEIADESELEVVSSAPEAQPSASRRIRRPKVEPDPDPVAETARQEEDEPSQSIGGAVLWSVD